jgi:RNA-directed DNA polymerase
MPMKKSLVLTATPEQLREKFFLMKDRSHIAELLDIDIKTLIYHLYRVPEDKKYKTFEIPKSLGGTRTISAPITTIKIIQKKLNQVLQCMYKPRGSVHSYMHDRNIVTNAEQHLKRTLLLNIDLKDFFPSIHIGRIIGLFKHRPYNCTEVVAKTLAQLCCFRGTLPQGAPTSPILSNMICLTMDKEIEQLARKHDCIYTRYADDISISTMENDFPNAIAKYNQHGQLEVGEELQNIIRTNSFEINREKVRIRNPDERQLVTGIVTNEFPNVRREYVRKIRAMLHALEKFGLEDAEKEYHAKYFNQALRNPSREPPSFMKVLKGKIDYLGMVRGKENPIYLNFMHKLRELAPEFVNVEETNTQFLIRSARPALSLHTFRPTEVGEHTRAKLSDLLNTIDPYYENKRTGAWVTFKGDSPDRIAQATHSMREVLNQLLEKLAPDEQVIKAPWYAVQTKGPKVTRKMRVRYILSDESQPASKSTVNFIDSLANTTDEMYGQLSKEAHKHGENIESTAEIYLHACELLLILILQNRKVAI